MNSFYKEDELEAIGFRSYGRNLKISRKASIYSPEQISIGNNVRIDDFCILSGNITIGSFVHISAYSALYALYGIILEDFVTISGRVIIYSQSDDYSGSYMTNPMVPSGYNHVTGSMVVLKKHSIIGAGSIVLPSVTMYEGSCLGAMSLLKCDASPWTIYGGVPAKIIKERKRDLLTLEKKLIKSLQ